MQGSLGIKQDGAFLKEVPSITACHGLSVSLCRRCYSFGDARLVNHKQYLAGGGYLKSLGTSNEMMLFMALLYTLFEGGKEFLQVGVLRPHALSGKRGSAREGKRIMPKHGV